MPSVVNGRAKQVYTDDPATNAMLDFMDERADAWMAQTDIVAATHGMCAVFAKFAPPEILQRFRGMIEAHLHLSFVEGGFRAWEEISDQQRALGHPLPRLTPSQEPSNLTEEHQERGA